MASTKNDQFFISFGQYCHERHLETQAKVYRFLAVNYFCKKPPS